MNRTRRRQFLAHFLLSVFVLMLLAESMHRHESCASDSVECADCAHQVAHAGHLSQGALHLSDCLLCQLASLPFVPVVPLQLTYYLVPSDALLQHPTVFLGMPFSSACRLRAPPIGF